MNLAFPTDLVPPYAPAGDHGIHRHPSRISEAALVGEVARMRTDPSIEFQTEAAARRHGIPSFAFIKAFKRLTGISPQRFHAALRIEHAKQLLVDTDRPVTDVSLDVGYNSLGTFVRTFTLLVGLPPTQLRRFARGDCIDTLLAEMPIARPKEMTSHIRAAIVDAPGGMTLAAGLFPQGLPTGLPLDGSFVDPATGDFELRWDPRRGQANLLAAALALGSIQEAWAGRFRSISVCSRRVSAASNSQLPIELHLRPLTVTDPPFLTPVPLLMLLQSRRSIGTV